MLAYSTDGLADVKKGMACKVLSSVSGRSFWFSASLRGTSIATSEITLVVFYCKDPFFWSQKNWLRRSHMHMIYHSAIPPLSSLKKTLHTTLGTWRIRGKIASASEFTRQMWKQRGLSCRVQCWWCIYIALAPVFNIFQSVSRWFGVKFLYVLLFLLCESSLI